MSITHLLPHEAAAADRVRMIDGIQILTIAEGSSTIMLDPLPNVGRWTLTLDYGQEVPGGGYIVFQHEIYTPSISQPRHTFTIDPHGSLSLDFIDMTRSASVTVTIEGSASPEGSARIALLAYLPDPAYNSALLGSAILGAFSLPSRTARTDWTILGRSYLGASFLYSAPDFHHWHTITSNALSIDIVRGLETTPMTAAASVGTLTASFINALDPRASALNRGTRIIAMDMLTRRRLFTGCLESFESTPEPDGTYTVTITAFDTVAQLSAVKVYQRTLNRPTDWRTAFADLLGDIPHALHGYVGRPTIGALVKEASLAQYLDIYAATAALSWWIDAQGVINIVPEHDSEPTLGLAISSSHSVRGERLDPVSVNASLNTGHICTAIEIENNLASYDSEHKEWRASSETIKIDNPTLMRAYGHRPERIETCGRSDLLRTYYMSKIYTYDPWQGITNASFLLYDWGNYIDAHTQASALICSDIGTVVDVSYRNQTPALEYITRIEHHISPHTWTCSINLTQL